MIDVKLETGDSAPFCSRCLMWVWGQLKILPGNPAGDQPLYRLENARASRAEKPEITKYFE